MTTRGDPGPDETRHLPEADSLPLDPAPGGPAATQPLGPLPARGPQDPEGAAGSDLAGAALRWSLVSVAVSAAFGLILGLIVTELAGRLGVLPCICVVVPLGPVLNLYRLPFRTIARYEQWHRRYPAQPIPSQDAATLRWARLLAILAPVLWLVVFLALMLYIFLRVE